MASSRGVEMTAPRLLATTGHASVGRSLKGKSNATLALPVLV